MTNRDVIKLKRFKETNLIKNRKEIVMEYNENLVTEEVTENVEQTTEETPVSERTFTQDEVNDIVGKAKSRAKAQAKKEYDRKFGDLFDVLKAGTGKETVEEMTDTFSEFYRSKGIEISKKPTYSKSDLEVLARAEADEIIKAGYEEVVEEVDRLTDLGVENMTEREKAVYLKLDEYIRSTETGRELKKIGVTEDVYGSDEFKSFAKKFDSKTPITEIYEIYNKTQPKKEIHTMGSIKHNASDKGELKDFYSREEAMKFTVEDFNKNPALFKRVEESMRKW
jgi:hypothetical protein